MIDISAFDRPEQRLCAALIAKAAVDLLEWERHRVRTRKRVPLLTDQKIARNAYCWLLGSFHPDRLSFDLAADVIGIGDREEFGFQIVRRLSTRAITDLDAPARWPVDSLPRLGEPQAPEVCRTQEQPGCRPECPTWQACVPRAATMAHPR